MWPIPHQDWVVFHEVDRLTYADLWDLAGLIAAAVADTAGPDPHLALLLGSVIEFLPALYGAMRAGGVAGPLYPQAEGRFLQGMIEDSDASVLVAEAGSLDHVFELGDWGRA